METELPISLPVLGLHWGQPGLFVSSKSMLRLYRLKTEDDDLGADESSEESNNNMGMDVEDEIGGTAEPLPPLVKEIVKFDCIFDVQDVTSRRDSGTTVFGACDDCKVRAWDVETQKMMVEFSDHKMPVEVCRAK
jgi:hypothetical protein